MGLLRFLLAVSVVLFHSSPILGIRLVGGQTAVETFFIISGFYMALIINDKYTMDGKFSYRLFVENRLLRIFPSYWVVLLVTIITYFGVLWVRGQPMRTLTYWVEHVDSMNPYAFLLLALSNVLTLGMDAIGAFVLNPNTGFLALRDQAVGGMPCNRFMFVPQAWTLSIEFLFYFLAPFLVRRSIGVVALLASIALMWRVFGPSIPYFPFPSYLVFFLSGVLAYKAYTSTRHTVLPEGRYWRCCNWIAFVAMILALLSYSLFTSSYRNPLYYSLMSLLLPFLFDFTKRNRIDRFLGELSYPIYICHLFVKYILHGFFDPSPNTDGVLLTILTVACAVGLFFLVDRPVDRFRQSRVAKCVESKETRIGASLLRRS